MNKNKNKTRYSIIKKAALTVSLFAVLAGPIPAAAQRSTADILDGVLSGMTGSQKRSGDDFNFDNLISAMEGKSKGKETRSEEQLMASIASVMDAYSYDYQDSWTNSGLSHYNNQYSGLYSGQGSGRPNITLPGGAMLPVVGRLTSDFGYRPKFGRHHKGVDIALNVGDTVRAALDGIVARVANDPNGYGLFVCLRHDNGMETRYAHLSKTIVVPGTRIMAGDAVGLGGSTGNSTGPHLHFETRVNGVAYDPTTLFDFSNPGRAFKADKYYMADNGYPYQSTTYPAGNKSQSNAVAQTGPQRSTYVVKAGDTVGSVAQKNGVSVLKLCRLNMLSTNETLQPGRMLKLR